LTPGGKLKLKQQAHWQQAHWDSHFVAQATSSLARFDLVALVIAKLTMSW